jgi:hypothetical protein
LLEERGNVWLGGSGRAEHVDQTHSERAITDGWPRVTCAGLTWRCALAPAPAGDDADLSSIAAGAQRAAAALSGRCPRITAEIIAAWPQVI